MKTETAGTYHTAYSGASSLAEKLLLTQLMQLLVLANVLSTLRRCFNLDLVGVGKDTGAGLNTDESFSEIAALCPRNGKNTAETKMRTFCRGLVYNKDKTQISNLTSLNGLNLMSVL